MRSESVSGVTVLRWATALVMALALVAITARTVVEARNASEGARGALENAVAMAQRQQLYVEGGFFALVVIGLGMAVYIGSRGED